MRDRPHIFTLTGNLLAERTWDYANWLPGKTQRAVRESFQVGGKGINVSKMLNRLGAPNTALCFTGGAPGAECSAWLQRHAFNFKAFSSENSTRSGTIVRAPQQPETTFLGPDSPPTASALEACAHYLDAQPDGQILAICGSFPGWEDAAFEPLRSSLDRWLTRGQLAADVYGPPLAWLTQRPLALVKINTTEFQALGHGAKTTAEALKMLRCKSPVKRWVISDGPCPVWLQDQGEQPETCVPPTVTEVSATGSGDVMFASILDTYFWKGLTLVQSVAHALPLAAANAAHHGIAEFP
jgi:1-phosphofructokinase